MIILILLIIAFVIAGLFFVNKNSYEGKHSEQSKPVFGLLNSNIETLKFNEHQSQTLNPTCGLYFPVDTKYPLSIKEEMPDDISILFLTYDIEDFKQKPLSEEKLNELESCLSIARNKGLKVIFRTAYGFNENSREPNDMSIIENHIYQLEPVLNKYSDILYIVQAGILGPWGEWHSSTHGDPPTLDVRMQVIDLWEDTLPKNTFIAVRRPSFVRDMFPEQVLSETNAYSNNGIAKVSWHNDALLADETDMGTYHTDMNRNEELKWSNNHNNYTPFGGEMNALSDYNKPENAVKDFKELRLNYLNIAFNTDIFDSWKQDNYHSENAYEYITRHIGYRLILDEVKLSKTIDDNKLNINATIKNLGFSNVYSDYNVYLVVKDNYGIIQQSNLDIDIKNCTPEHYINIGKTLDINNEIEYSENISIGIEISDSAQSLCDDNRYNIIFSNEGIDYSDRINYFANYTYSNGKFTLVY